MSHVLIKCKNCGCDSSQTETMILKGSKYFFQVDKKWFENYRDKFGPISKSARHKTAVREIENSMFGFIGFRPWLAGYILIKDVGLGKLVLEKSSWDEYMESRKQK